MCICFTQKMLILGLDFVNVSLNNLFSSIVAFFKSFCYDHDMDGTMA